MIPPWTEHARWYPNCDYLGRRKGDLFIEMYRQDRNKEKHFVLPTSRTYTAITHQTITTRCMENVIGKSSREGENGDVAVRIVLVICYAKPTVDSTVEQLRKQGKSKYTSMGIMQIILDLLTWKGDKHHLPPPPILHIHQFKQERQWNLNFASLSSADSLFEENRFKPPSNLLLTVTRRCFCYGYSNCQMFIRFLLVFDLLFILFMIALWPSAGKELSPWRFTYAVLF